jgi:hypothetical protein
MLGEEEGLSEDLTDHSSGATERLMWSSGEEW